MNKRQGEHLKLEIKIYLCLGSGTIVVMDTTCVCVTVSRAHAHMESVTGNRSRTMDFSCIDILIREMVSEFKRLLAYFEWLRRGSVMDSKTHTHSNYYCTNV